MAFVQVPPDSTGKKVDTNTIGATERQIAILGDAVSSSGLAVVTTSAGLMVNVTSGTILSTAGTNPWSSAPSFNVPTVSASSGLLQVILVTSSGVNLYTTQGLQVVITGTSGVGAPVTSSGGVVVTVAAGTVTAASTVATNPWSSAPSFNVPVVNASSGLVQIIPVTSSGINLYTTQGLQVILTGSSGVSTPVTSSGGALVAVTNPVGISSGTVTLSSAPAVVAASSGITQVIPVTSSGVNLYTTQGINVILTGSSGVGAPVTSSGGVIASVTPYYSSSVQAAGVIAVTYYASCSGNSNAVKTSPGQFYGFYAFNTTQAIRYLKVYATSSAPTVGSTAAQIGNYGIPASTGTGGGGSQHLLPWAVQTSQGIGITIVTGPESSSTGILGTGDVVLTLYYI